MTIALIGALLLGQFAEAAALAFLFSISEALEDYSLSRTRRGLRALLALVPTEITVLRGAEQHTVSPAELRVGDLMLVRAGERIPSDGVVRTGRSSVDTSAITGESMPIEIGPGDDAFAGSINANGVLTIEATSTVRTTPSRRSSGSWRTRRNARATGNASPTGSRARWCRR